MLVSRNLCWPIYFCVKKYKLAKNQVYQQEPVGYFAIPKNICYKVNNYFTEIHEQLVNNLTMNCFNPIY